MVKSYSLLFGSKSLKVDQIQKLISEQFDYQFEDRSSDYYGDYCLFRGTVPDRIMIYENDPFNDFDFLEKGYQEYSSLIFVHFSQGKNLQKSTLKEKFQLEFPQVIHDLQLLRLTESEK
jgi:hypothetical protein